MLRQFDYRAGFDIDAGSALYRIQDNRNIYAVSDGVVVLNQSLLGCFVIVWSDLQQRVSARFFSFYRQVDAVFCIVAARAGDYRDAAFDFVHTVRYDFDLFFVCHSGGFSRGSAGDDRVRTFRDLPFDEFSVIIEIYGSVFIKRCDDSDTGSSENSHNSSSLIAFYLPILSSRSSAIWTAFVAAPLRMLSATTQILIPFSTLKSRLTLPT